MTADPLSDALALVRARCVITGGFTASGDWSVRFRPSAALKLKGLVRGRCWLVADGRPPQRLAQGNVAVFNRLDSFVLCSDPALPPVEEPEAVRPGPGPLDRFGDQGDADDGAVVIGGHIDLDRSGDELLLAVLPRLTVLSEADGILRLLEQLLDERAATRPGANFAADQYAQLLLVQVLRAVLERGTASRPGWLTVLADPDLRPALSLMHTDPGRAWGLDELARASAMSRSRFATRFREVSGQPPVAYLTRWRIRLAERALRETDTTVAALAAELGYASESSFSHAFARTVGVSPGRFRRAVRGQAQAPTGA
ncbi:AraC family transcriptional regulator [Cryptosporangium phraense]|uniref:AraC family transcriptional regulator n=1 Tax=Cryptosporangium phraense TaxID=2593070 RepID=UPI0014791E2F|nr:AraC family transcriptional regulator [Cryptosporangium phraense]